MQFFLSFINNVYTITCADGFAEFFSRKVDDVMSATAGQPAPTVIDSAPSSLPSFRRCSETEVRRIVMSSAVKPCSLDPVPTFLLREFVDLLLPYVTCMVNASLSQGRLPESQKHAVVTPLLKKRGLDTSNMANFRPVVERAVAKQLNEHLTANDLLPRY